MELARAKELLYTLADGVNPLTGEVLSDADACNQADIVRALYAVLQALDSPVEKPKRPLPEKAGKPWTPDDDAMLCRMFDEGFSKQEICAHFKRTIGSISARLVRLDKISSRDEFRYGR